VHEPDRSRLKVQMVCPEHRKAIHAEHIQRGYEYEPDRYVVILDSDIESIAPKRSTTIEIREFVEVDSIGPEWYDRPYCIRPIGAEKAYQLLVDVLGSLHKAGLSESSCTHMSTSAPCKASPARFAC